MHNLHERVRFLVVFAVALLFLVSAKSVFAAPTPITTLFSTGVDGSGAPLADGTIDPHYTVNGGNAYTIGNPGSIGWVGNTATSSWISAAPDARPGGGPFTYHTTFDLTGFDPSTALISGLLSADDQATIYLNGVLAFTGDPDAFQPWSYYQAFSITSGSVAGINSLDAVVPNNVETPNDGPTGVQLDISGTVGTPEPGTLTLLDLGIGALKLRRRRA